MSRALSSVLAIVLLLLTVAPTSAAKDGLRAADDPPVTPAGGQIVPGQVVVKFRDEARGLQLASSRGLAVVAEKGAPVNGGPALLSTQGRPVEAVIAELTADPSVAYAEPNYVVQLASTVSVNDPMAPNQYSLDQMKVRHAWTLTKGGTGVVAVLDTGVQADHPDLKGRVLAGRNIIASTANAADDNGHGTWVAGIIAAKANDGYGIAGISWTDKILPVKIMNSNGTGVTSDLEKGIRWAADNGATIINMSVGGFPYLQSVQDAVNYAAGKDVVLIGAAGNNNRWERFYPASYDNVVSVSATQVNDEFSHWSSYGSAVDVSAPGSSVLTTNCIASTCPNPGWGSHTYISGTSFATPNVAGVVALLRARFPAETQAQIVARLVSTVDDLGFTNRDDRYGQGRVNAFRALGGSIAQPTRLAGDAWESNLLLSTAKAIALGTTISPTIWPAGDADHFAVDLPRMGRLDVRVTGVIDSRDYPWHKSGLPIDPVVELYDTAGTLLTRVDAVWESGTELAQLNVAGPTRIIIRVHNYFANGNRTNYTLRTDFVDELPPRATKMIPAPGSGMISPLSDVTFTFSEPVSGVTSSSVSLRRSDGSVIPSLLSYSRSTGLVRLVPSAPLPSNELIRLRLTDDIVDDAGLHLVATSYSFTTMPGETLAGPPRATFSAGTRAGHRIGVDGRIQGLKISTLGSTSGANIVQRATLPNLPGAWLFVHNGVWAGHWVREGADAAVNGVFDVIALPTTTRITFGAGTHVGRQYDVNGAVLASKSHRLWAASGANADALAVINGQRHYRVVNGIWAGYWVAESGKAHRAGIVDRLGVSRRVQIRAGTHTGIAVTSTGTVTGTRLGRLDRTSGASVSAWAMVNGQPYVLVANGMWAGYWLPERAILAWEH